MNQFNIPTHPAIISPMNRVYIQCIEPGPVNQFYIKLEMVIVCVGVSKNWGIPHESMYNA